MINYLKLGTESGYGGPLVTGPLINEVGTIEEVLLVDDKETHSFIQKTHYQQFLRTI